MKIELCAFADEAADDLSGQIAALKRNNIRKIELRNLGGVNVKDLSEEAATAAEAEFSASGIAVWSIGSPIGKSEIAGDFAAVQNDLAHILRLCKIFRCKNVRVFSFFTTDYENVKEEVFRRMKQLVEQAKKEGVELCHENEKDIFGDKASRAEALLNEVKDLKSVYDPANYLQVGERTENLFSMRRRAKYFHIKDVLPTGELVPAGEGEGNIPGLVSELTQDTVLTLEPHLAVFSGYASIDSHEMKNKYEFSSRGEAFDTAVTALKNILRAQGFTETEGGFVK